MTNQGAASVDIEAKLTLTKWLAPPFLFIIEEHLVAFDEADANLAEAIISNK